MYQALYRKYRPRTFDNVAGQEHITSTLKNQTAAGRASHAYLFVGTRGTGKTTCAKILARAVNCEHPKDGNPCNECPSCRSIESGQATDVLEIDAASNNGVDNVRALRDEAVFSPASAKMRVYIIDEVHMLSGSAFNALLKILEEPPEHLLFILATTELHKVPATVISRCQRFSFRRLSRDVISERLLSIASREEMKLSGDASALLSRLSDGSMRDAISLLDQCGGVPDIDLKRVRDVLGLPATGEAYKLLEAVALRDANRAFAILDELYSAGKQASSLFDELAELTRDTLVASLIQGSESLLSGAMSQGELKMLAKKMPPARLTHILSVLIKTEFTRGSGDRLKAEICLASLCDERLDTWPEALVARIDALEAGNTLPRQNNFSEPEGFDIPDEAIMQEAEPVIEVLSEPELVPETIAESEIVDLKPEEQIFTAQPDTDIWREIFSQLPPSLSSAIANTSAALDGATLRITAFDAFTLNFVSSEKTVQRIRDAAAKLVGHDISIKAELGSVPSETQTKLDDLSERFDGLFTYE